MKIQDSKMPAQNNQTSKSTGLKGIINRLKEKRQAQVHQRLQEKLLQQRQWEDSSSRQTPPSTKQRMATAIPQREEKYDPSKLETSLCHDFSDDQLPLVPIENPCVASSAFVLGQALPGPRNGSTAIDVLSDVQNSIAEVGAAMFRILTSPSTGACKQTPCTLFITHSSPHI
jgi:hypothetical protein